MPMPTKGTRTIDVNGTTFRYGWAARNGVEVVVERQGGGRRLIARFDPFVLHGHEAQRDRLSKRVVRVAVVEALRRGWRPDERGPPFVLTEADVYGEHPGADWSATAGVPQALLRAVLDAPEDDAPRRVLADWLIEREDPRGAMIHQQLDGQDGAALLERYWRRWSAPAWRVARRWRFARGFVDHLVLRGPPPPDAWDVLHATEPVRSFELDVAPETSLDDLLRPTHREVVLRGALDRRVSALWRSPWFGRLRRLALHGDLGEARALEIAEHASRAGLEVLDLRFNRIALGARGDLLWRAGQTRVRLA
jgi:uncharacterized protein (TIGR02996 family)